MAHGTGIQWTDATWNPIRGCSRVSDGCRHCYAEAVAARFSGPGQAYEGLARRRSNGEPQWTGEVRVVKSHMLDPIRWRRPRRIFVNSMSDLFHENVSERTIDRVFAVMASAPRHTFQILTKRPALMLEYVGTPGRAGAVSAETADDPRLRFIRPDDLAEIWPLPNVWLGVSVENDAVSARIDALLRTPAAVRFISAEPLLGPLDLRRVYPPECGGTYAFDALTGREWFPGSVRRDVLPHLDWVIVGGESGHHCRPCDVAWIRSIVAECGSASVPVFVKQLGGLPVIDGLNHRFGSHGGDVDEWPEDLRVREFPAGGEAVTV